MARREKNPEQILRIDGKNCFLEVMSSSFNIEKVRINFRTYDKTAQQGNRTNGKIDIYLDFKDFDPLYQGIMHNGNGYLMAEVYNNQYGATIYRGGTKKDGNITARELKLQVGNSKPLIFIAEQGPGKENSMGGFSIIRGNNTAITKIMIPMEFKDICHLCVSVNNAIIAYRAAQEVQKKMDFEFAKVKDLLTNIAMVVGCNQNDIMKIANREMPRPSWNNDNQNDNGYGNYNQNNNNYPNDNYQNNNYQNNSYQDNGYGNQGYGNQGNYNNGYNQPDNSYNNYNGYN